MTAPTPLTKHDFFGLMDAQGLDPARPVAVAVSGGADSMALLRLAADWGDAVTALTFDHGLRSASSEEARQVAVWCSELGVPHHILQSDRPPSPDRDVQQQAREARYTALVGWCRGNGCGDLLLAHHRQDQAETLLMRLFRGSGVDGLAAMRARSSPPDGGGDVVLHRPLLAIDRAQLNATLRDFGQDWIEDPSNHDERYERVRVRRLLQQMDDGELVQRPLASTATRMARVKDFLDPARHDWLCAHAATDEGGWVRFDLAAFSGAHEELRARLISRLLQTVSGQRHPPAFDAVMRIDRALMSARKNTDFDGLTSFGCQWLAAKDAIWVVREARAMAPPVPLEKEGTVWDGRYEVRLDPWQDGLTVGGLGEEGWRQWRSLGGEPPEPLPPHPARLSFPSLWRAETLLAAPHLGYWREGLGRLECRLRPRRPLFG